MQRTEHQVSTQDIRNLIEGEGGVDLARVIEGGRQVAMRIFGVSEGSTAARLGARNDDTIESINDVPLYSIEAAYRAGALAAQSQRIVVRGRRAGSEYETVLVVADAKTRLG